MSGQDVGFFETEDGVCPDLVIEDGDLKPDNSLQNSALISLYSDKRVTFEQLPQGERSRRGWWADLISEEIGDQIGSRLWTLDRAKNLNQVAVELESILLEAFSWMVEDGISNNVVVGAQILDNETIEGSVSISRPSGDNIPLKFAWDGQELKLTETE